MGTGRWHTGIPCGKVGSLGAFQGCSSPDECVVFGEKKGKTLHGISHKLLTVHRTKLLRLILSVL